MDMPVDVPVMVASETVEANGVTQLSGKNWVLDYSDDAHPVLLIKHDQVVLPPPVKAPTAVERQLATVYFPTGSSVIGKADAAELIATAIPGRYRISGHADPRGSEKYNKKLSEKRAAAVAKLLKKAGAEAVVVKGFGKKDTVSGGERKLFPKDRRVEVEPVRGYLHQK